MLCSLMSKPISAEIAVAAAKELFALGLRTPRKVLDADRSDMIRAFGRAHYVRHDESTARLPEMARLAMAKYHGDLRRLAAGSNHETAEVTRLLKEFRGIGDTGADIFLREVQDVWTWARLTSTTKRWRRRESLGCRPIPSSSGGWRRAHPGFAQRADTQAGNELSCGRPNPCRRGYTSLRSGI
jgi:hypothetical protein